MSGQIQPVNRPKLPLPSPLSSILGEGEREGIYLLEVQKSRSALLYL